MTENKHPYSSRKYEIVPYDPNWVNQFEDLKLKIQTVFKSSQIEHIGSTSVPGMSGKPCIDVLVTVDDIKEVENHVTGMENLGMEYAGEFVMKDSRLFRVMKNDTLLANIHFFPVGHTHNKEMLNMRDYLRANPEEVTQYSELKQDLYMKYKDDYASYRKYKDEYMDKLKGRVSGFYFK